MLEFINISTKFKASWSDKKRLKWSFKYEDIIDLFKYLINNIYVKFRGVTYKQVVGMLLLLINKNSKNYSSLDMSCMLMRNINDSS